MVGRRGWCQHRGCRILSRQDPGLHFWHEFHGPLVAALVTLALALGGRLLGVGRLAAVAGASGAAAGWIALTGAVTGSPRLLVERLPALALAAIGVPLLIEAVAPQRGRLVGAVLLAAGCGWWLAGGPRDRADLLQAWPVALAVAALVLLIARLLAGQSGSVVAGAAASLAVALQLAALPAIWPLFAWAVFAAALVLVFLPDAAGPALVPLAGDLAAAAAAPVLASGRLPRGGIGPVEFAAAAPLLALWLAPRLDARLRFAGRLSGALSAALAAALSVGVVRGCLALFRLG